MEKHEDIHMKHSEEQEIQQLENELKQFGSNADMFQVPEGYFVAFADRLSEQLPQTKEKRPTIISSLRRWSIAAGFVAILGLSAYWVGNNQSVSHTLESVAQSQSAPTEDDYVMIDNDAIYAYVSNP